VLEEAVKEVTGSPSSPWKKEENTTISFVLGVGMPSHLAGHHWSTSRSGRIDSQLTWESSCHLQRIAGTFVGEKQPWWGEESLRQRIEAIVGGRSKEGEEHKKRRRNGGGGESD
jgi:hypothetical protein